MSEYLKQLVLQLKLIWEKLNATQKGVLVATTVLVLSGLIAIIAWNTDGGENRDGYRTLFVNLETGEAATITAALKEAKVPYRLADNGRTVSVPRDKSDEARMELARKGLPRSGSQGYELFDKVQLGMTDFVQNLNYRRALEGELARTIETLHEVERARVHVTIPKPTLFTERKEEATASVILKLKPGAELESPQVRGITHLVASSVEGLKARQVAVLDMHGNLLTKGYADNGVAEQTDHNLALQSSVEQRLERKVAEIFDGLLGPGKARVKAAAQLDFNQVQKTVESYDPNTKVIRSQQRDDGMVRGSPNAQLEQKEGSITNYEFDRTVSRIVGTPGAVTRLTVSVAVDGTYKTGGDGKSEYVPRTPEELEKFSALVKNAVGYRPGSQDEVYLTNVQFDRERFVEEEAVFQKLERKEWIQVWQKYGVLILIALFGLWFLRGLVQNLSAAMNPPRPRYAGLNLEALEEKVPENVQKQKDILEKVEIMTHTEPVNIANLIKTWLHEESTGENREGKGRQAQKRG